MVIGEGASICGMTVEDIKSVVYAHLEKPTPEQRLFISGWAFRADGSVHTAGTALYGPRDPSDAELEICDCWFNRMELVEGG